MNIYTYVTLFPVGIRQPAGIWYKLTLHSVGTSMESGFKPCAKYDLVFFPQNVEYKTCNTFKKGDLGLINC